MIREDILVYFVLLLPNNMEIIPLELSQINEFP